jgi:hypothetical protein
VHLGGFVSVTPEHVEAAGSIDGCTHRYRLHLYILCRVKQIIFFPAQHPPAGHLRITSETEVLKAKVQHNIFGRPQDLSSFGRPKGLPAVADLIFFALKAQVNTQNFNGNSLAQLTAATKV